MIMVVTPHTGNTKKNANSCEQQRQIKVGLNPATFLAVAISRNFLDITTISRVSGSEPCHLLQSQVMMLEAVKNYLQVPDRWGEQGVQILIKLDLDTPLRSARA